jgi:hypothetical protein
MLQKDNQVISKSKWWFIVKRKTKKGGMFFMTADRVFTDPQGKPEITLFNWDWPGQDVVQACLDLLDFAFHSK